MDNFLKHYSRHLGVIGVVGLALLVGGFDLVLVALRGIRFSELHNLLGESLTLLATQFAPAPSATRAGTDRYVLITVLYFSASILRTLLFALLAWRRMRPNPLRSAAAGQMLLAAQLLLCLCGDPDLLIVFSMELALVLPLKRGLGWLLPLMLVHVAIQLLLAYSTGIFSDAQVRLRLLYLGMEVLVHALVFGVVHLATRERRARRILAAAHAELLATQSLLGDMVRDSERLRIARDLHDSVGHHLTALKLHLDLAVRQSGEPVPAALRTASELAAALLAEVRTVVSTERGAGRIDLHHALATLCAGIPVPRIALKMDAGLAIASPALAHALFCCAQEAISNTVRHAGASVLHIEVSRQGDELTMLADDDGRGNGKAGEGNGLRGMRERLALVGGRLHVGEREPRGYALHIAVPIGGVR